MNGRNCQLSRLRQTPLCISAAANQPNSSCGAAGSTHLCLKKSPINVRHLSSLMSMSFHAESPFPFDIHRLSDLDLYFRASKLLQSSTIYATLSLTHHISSTRPQIAVWISCSRRRELQHRPDPSFLWKHRSTTSYNELSSIGIKSHRSYFEKKEI